MSRAAIVLCGGRSTRMGRAKALLPWQGRPMISHVVESLREGGAVEEVIVVTSNELQLSPLNATIVCDRQPSLGPLAGIREGLAQMKSDRAYVTSTDAPFLTPRFVAAMFEFGDAAAPEVDGFVQTLAAVYPRRALPCAEALLTADKLRPLQLLKAIGYRKVPAQELPDIESTRGFNTPAEYLAAVRQTAPNSTAVVELQGEARNAAGKHEWEVPVGTLAEALSHIPGLEALDRDTSGRILAPFRLSLNGGESLQDLGIPIGPGERVVLADAAS